MASSCTVAVLGGGITGLSAAFHLSRRLPPTARIILLEKQRRLGGWIRSQNHQGLAPRGQDVVLDTGPRTLRPNSKALLELINLLGLNESVVTVPKSHPAARSRYIYAPPLTALPSSVASLLKSPFTPALRPLLPAVLREPLRRANRPPDITDESVHAFVSRRFGEEFARVFVSALVHGIYGADSRLLSVRSAFSSLWEAEERGWGSVVRGFARSALSPASKRTASTEYHIGEMENMMKDISIYAFRGGMETLPRAIYDWLKSRPNVDIHTGVDVRSLTPLPAESRFEVWPIATSAGPLITNPTHIVSALPLSALHNIIPPLYALPHLTANPSSTIQVLNIVFPPTEAPLHPPGFGYLVPRPKGGYSIANEPSHYIIGCIFHSGVFGPSPSPRPPTSSKDIKTGAPPSDTPTTLTVMLRSPTPILDSTRLPEPIHMEMHVQSECIPTYTVGHGARMRDLKAALEGGAWGGRMEVVGAGVGGVSVGDCVEAGRNAGKRWGF
ncbi:hypothetical protein BOTBODRAFT_116965 [Botryobasidium botryosum FD-172 SS1]|uniref:Protoporphyrinogen oxidase n=1 Tax=Botryobasidium botryosum (strain FD-172 SS1) TaxID=930990 RepID=A0A067M1M3_BOTB1|nr:hypothetical protein BOTBODRAFT_116965 [Botryobasidium botryosum FD-172 SS1]